MRLDPLSRSAAEQAALVREGRLSARELVDAALAAIERDDPGLNAFVLTCPERARAEADAIGPGDPRPLAGVPVAIKDLIVLTEGLRDRQRAAARSATGRRTSTPAPVARLRAAGAIVVGKTNTPEWGMRPVTEPERYGPARNPWDPELITGGSSGGSAAAVAAGMVAAGARQRRRRLDPDPGVLLRRRRAQADPLPRPARPRAGRVRGLRRRRRAHPHRARHRARARRARGGGPVDAARAAAPAPLVRRRGGASPPHPLRIRLCTTAPDGVEVEPECVAAAHHAAGLLVALGHEVDEWAPDWEDPEFAGHWAAAGAAMFQALIARFGELAGARARPRADGARHPRAARRAGHARGARTRRPRA